MLERWLSALGQLSGDQGNPLTRSRHGICGMVWIGYVTLLHDRQLIVKPNDLFINKIPL